MTIKIEISVCNEWLVQGAIKWDDRFFWYKCKNGSQYLAEITCWGWDKNADFAEIQSTCLCNVFGNDACVDGICDRIWSDDLQVHVAYAGLLVGSLIR